MPQPVITVSVPALPAINDKEIFFGFSDAVTVQERLRTQKNF